MRILKSRVLLCVALGSLGAVAADGQAQNQDLTQLSLDELMRIEVVSASKRTQSLQDVAGSVFVVTAEDIRRVGARSVPEALRVVPGVQVGRINGSTWSVSIRGFGSRFSNKLLVLIDGRSIYTPLFSGVHWDAVDLPMDTIDRIEVVRGPGGAVWGANAVNGVINIVTKPASETQGDTATVGGGSHERALAKVQHGGAFDHGFWRVNVGGHDFGPTLTPSGGSGQDSASSRNLGFALEWNPTVRDAYQFNAGLFQETTTQVLSTPLLGPPYVLDTLHTWDAQHSFARGAWQRDSGSAGKTSVQLSIDGYGRDTPEIRESRSTWDLEVRHERMGAKTTTLFGAGYRTTLQDTVAGHSVSVDPASERHSLLNVFWSSESIIAPNTRLTLGAKLEHSEHSGWKLEPNIRILKSLTETNAVWAAVSHSVRNPREIDAHGYIEYSASPGPGGLPVLATLNGTDAFRSEELTAYEAGWRSKIGPATTVDLSAYYNAYDRLRTFEPQAAYFDPNPVPHWVQPYVFGNLLHGYTTGAELVVRHQPRKDWGLMFGYTFENQRLTLYPASADPFGAGDGDGRERGNLHQFSMRSTMDLHGGIELDTAVYYTGHFASVTGVSPHTRLDVRLGWKPNDNVTVSLSVRDLLVPRTQETAETFLLRSNAVPRRFLAQVSWRF